MCWTGCPRSGSAPATPWTAYSWLEQRTLSGADLPKRMEVLRTLGAPYTDEEIAQSTEAVKGKTELEAVIAYLQGLGTAVR